MLTIIKNFRAYSEYAYERIDLEVLAIFRSLLSNISPSAPPEHALLSIECYLQITDQFLKKSDLRSSVISALCNKIVRAIYSDEFIDASLSKRCILATQVYELFELATAPYLIELSRKYRLSWFSTPNNLDENEFSKPEAFNQEKIEIWRAWPTVTRQGKVLWLPFFGISQKLGLGWTRKLYAAVDSFASARRIDMVRGVRDLCSFIIECGSIICEADLHTDYIRLKFWHDFLMYYLEKNFNDGEGSSITHLTSCWNGEIKNLVTNFICKANIIAEPNKGFPSIPVNESRELSRVLSLTSSTRQGMSLTSIPIHISDALALEQLGNKILADLDAIVTWARLAIEEHLALFRKRREALDGESLSRETAIANIIEHIETDNLKKHVRKHKDHYKGKRLGEISREYGAVSPVSLIPFCVILIYNHPEITPGFLEQVLAFDHNGNSKNVRKSDGKIIIKGDKRRKGFINAEQTITLNAEAEDAIRGLLEITEYARSFLRNQENSDSRYLLICTGSSILNPYRIKRLATLTSGHNIPYIAADIEARTDLNTSEASQLASRFSLRTLRVSVGLKTYLETESISETSKALGHTSVDRRLMDIYLPQSIVNFFRDRWIRIFQTGITLEAMKGSEYFFDVTSLSTEEEIAQFLKNHGIDYSTFLFSDTEKRQPKGELIIGVSIDLLRFFLRIKNHGKDLANMRTLTFIKLGERITDYIKHHNSERPDLYKMLIAAEALAGGENQ